jgi:1-acyl-sn-glycerol-3-phosphate acyltransferase
VELLDRPVKLKGNRMARAVLGLAGWRIRFDGLPARQGVAIVYPHTSNWDFVVGMLAKWGIGIDVTFWGKDTLFRVPLFGRWLRWLGGVPVDRAAPRGVALQMAKALADARRDGRFLWLALSPEGTRGLNGHWRTGFYHVALEAGVPLGLAYFDYRERVFGIENFIMLSGDRSTDMAEIDRVLGHRQGRRPALATPIRMKEP